MQFHPESVLSEHGDRLVANFLALGPGSLGCGGGRPVRPVRPARPGDAAAAHDPEVVAFAAAAARSPRMFWLDGGGARRQAGAAVAPTLGVLAPEDVSLSFDAGRAQVLRHQHGEARVVGDDVFTVLEEELDRDGGDPDVSWVGYLGYACRTDLPGRTG